MVGPSMEPAVRNGEWWLVRRGGQVSPGDAILIRHPRRSDLLVVKRAVRRDPDGWWVLGDNPDQSEDSRHFGAIGEQSVIGRLTRRYYPLRRR